MITSMKRLKRKRLSRKDRADEYVHRHNLFYPEPPTKEEIDMSLNTRKKKRVKPKQAPVMSREEHVKMLLGKSELFEMTEEDANRWYDLTVFQGKLDAIRGRTKKQTEELKAAFFEIAEREIMSRYAPARLEEKKAQIESEDDEQDTTSK